MIVKIKNTDDSYSYFEGDSVIQSRSELKLVDLQKVSNPDTLFITSGNGEEMNYLYLNILSRMEEMIKQ